jgi:hypothetical protein
MERQTVLTEKHHALLYAWIVRETITRFGKERGEAAARAATRRYGEQRGRRMALRAQANGDVLNMTSYLTYGEWRSATPEGASEQREQGEHIYTLVTDCPWANAWQENGLTEYGRLYCQEIDEALARGFNPDLFVEVKQTLSNEGRPCDFVFHQAALPQGGTLAHVREKAASLTDQNVMPWEYHCGHLYKTFSETLGEQFGEEGRLVAEEALKAFGDRFGAQAAKALLAYRDTDFDRLP